MYASAVNWIWKLFDWMVKNLFITLIFVLFSYVNDVFETRKEHESIIHLWFLWVLSFRIWKLNTLNIVCCLAFHGTSTKRKCLYVKSYDLTHILLGSTNIDNDFCSISHIFTAILSLSYDTEEKKNELVKKSSLHMITRRRWVEFNWRVYNRFREHKNIIILIEACVSSQFFLQQPANFTFIKIIRMMLSNSNN